MLWLTPVRQTEHGWVLHEERIAYKESELAPVLTALREVHPRLLPLVKAAILPDEPEAEEEEALICGTVADFDLSVPGHIIFDGMRWRLSHCGESFFRMLLPKDEAVRLLSSVVQVQGDIVGQITDWVKQGMYAVVIKE